MTRSVEVAASCHDSSCWVSTSRTTTRCTAGTGISSWSSGQPRSRSPVCLGDRRRRVDEGGGHSPEVSVDVDGCWLVPSWRAAQPCQEVPVEPATMPGPGDIDDHVRITGYSALLIQSWMSSLATSLLSTTSISCCDNLSIICSAHFHSLESPLSESVMTITFPSIFSKQLTHEHVARMSCHMCWCAIKKLLTHSFTPVKLWCKSLVGSESGVVRSVNGVGLVLRVVGHMGVVKCGEQSDNATECMLSGNKWRLWSYDCILCKNMYCFTCFLTYSFLIPFVVIFVCCLDTNNEYILDRSPTNSGGSMVAFVYKFTKKLGHFSNCTRLLLHRVYCLWDRNWCPSHPSMSACLCMVTETVVVDKE